MKYKGCVYGCFTLVFIVLAIYLFSNLHFIIVRDSSTGKPISNAKIQMSGSDWFNGCDSAPTISYKTNFLGTILAFNRHIANNCSIYGYKNGYHLNGKPNFKIVTTFKLNKVSNPQIMPMHNLSLHSGEGIDVLSLLRLKPKVSIPESFISSPAYTNNADFRLDLENGCPESASIICPGEAKITFFGDGGIINTTPYPLNNNGMGGPYDYSYTTFWDNVVVNNISVAPSSGYKKTLNLTTGGKYIARLKDGKHFIKIDVFVISKDLKNKPEANLYLYIQPNASRNIETSDGESDFTHIFGASLTDKDLY